MSFGSMARFTARMQAISDDGDPQTSKWRLASVGHCNTIAELPFGNAARSEDAALAYCIADGGSTESGTMATESKAKPARPTKAGSRLLSSAADSIAAMVEAVSLTLVETCSSIELR